MGFNITKKGNIFFQWYELVLGYHIFIENLDRPLKVKLDFFKGCLVYGICQKRIGKAKIFQQKLNWSDLTGPSNSWKCSKIERFAQNAKWPKTQIFTVLKHCSLIIFVRYIKKIARHITILNFPKNDPPYCDTYKL